MGGGLQNPSERKKHQTFLLAAKILEGKHIFNNFLFALGRRIVRHRIMFKSKVILSGCPADRTRRAHHGCENKGVRCCNFDHDDKDPSTSTLVKTHRKILCVVVRFLPSSLLAGNICIAIQKVALVGYD